MSTLYEVYEAIGTTGNDLADDLCASFARSSESERSALRGQRPDIFEERNYPLADEEENKCLLRVMQAVGITELQIP